MAVGRSTLQSECKVLFLCPERGGHIEGKEAVLQ